jgi:CBS domain-containing protein
MMNLEMMTVQDRAVALLAPHRTERVAVVETAGRGVVRYYDATAEFYRPNTKGLTIVSTLEDKDLAFFSPDEWRSVSVLDGKGVLLFSITHGDHLRVVDLSRPNTWPVA